MIRAISSVLQTDLLVVHLKPSDLKLARHRDRNLLAQFSHRNGQHRGSLRHSLKISLLLILTVHFQADDLRIVYAELGRRIVLYTADNGFGPLAVIPGHVQFNTVRLEFPSILHHIYLDGIIGAVRSAVPRSDILILEHSCHPMRSVDQCSVAFRRDLLPVRILYIILCKSIISIACHILIGQFDLFVHGQILRIKEIQLRRVCRQLAGRYLIDFPLAVWSETAKSDRYLDCRSLSGEIFFSGRRICLFICL